MTDYRATELYSSGGQNAAFSYIILRLIYIRGLIHGIGRGVPNAPLLILTFTRAVSCPRLLEIGIHFQILSDC